jgi:Domain of unknown function (DUF4288)
MNSSPDISPVGWYVGTYQLRFVEIHDKRNNDPKRRFLTWENTALIKAKSLREAHQKLVKLGKGQTKPYKGGPDAVDVRWLFEGVIELLPVYEEIADGGEIMWAERTRSLKSIRRLAKKASEFKQPRVVAQQTAARDRVKKRGA